MERWLSGLRRSLGKRVYVCSVPRVRIPPSPPEKSKAPSGAFCFSRRVWLRMRTLVDGRSGTAACPVAKRQSRPFRQNVKGPEWGLLRFVKKRRATPAVLNLNVTYLIRRRSLPYACSWRCMIATSRNQACHTGKSPWLWLDRNCRSRHPVPSNCRG